jgi:hypothetical protein
VINYSKVDISIIGLLIADGNYRRMILPRKIINDIKAESVVAICLLR